MRVETTMLLHLKESSSRKLLAVTNGSVLTYFPEKSASEAHSVFFPFVPEFSALSYSINVSYAQKSLKIMSLHNILMLPKSAIQRSSHVPRALQ